MRGAVPTEEHDDEAERGHDSRDDHQGVLAEIERAPADADLANSVCQP